MEENHERSFASVYTKLLNRLVGNCKTIVQVSLFRANFKKFALYQGTASAAFGTSARRIDLRSIQ